MATPTDTHQSSLRRESPPLRAQSRAGEGAARAALRGQIAHLERRLAATTFELWESRSVEQPRGARTARPTAARLLTLGELEAVRDALVAQLHAGRRTLEQHGESHERARARLEAMLAEPDRHRYEVVRHSDLGEPGCGAYHVLPRLGLLGMLFGWWCVKLSSGCP
jgi:hypothetical protein